MDAKSIQAAPPATQSGARVASSRKRDPLRGIRWATYALIILTVGRINDILPALSSFPLVKMLFAYLALAIFVQRKLLPDVITPGNPAIKWAMALGAWVVFSFSFSIWLGPSFNFIIGSLPVLAAIVWVVCKLSGTWESLRSIFLALVVAAMILVIPGLIEYGGGRLSVQSMYDENDLAYVLGGIAPIAVAFGVSASSRWRRLLAFGSAAVVMLTVLLTGSRGGMIGLLSAVAATIVALSALSRRGAETKAPIVRKTATRVKTRIFLSFIACALLGVAIWPQLPPETQERFSSLLSMSEDYNLDARWGRMEIWKRGMQALGDRPIGHGVGAFQMVDGRYGGTYLTAHNSLVLVVVELGIVGLILYLGVLVHVWRGLTRVCRRLVESEKSSSETRQQAVFCRMLQASLVGNLVSGLFLSSAYFYSHWVIIALGIACISLLSRESPGSIRDKGRAFGQ